MNNFGEHLEIVLRKMCNSVNAIYSVMDFKKEQWFWDYTWTKEQEEEFRQWFITYLIDNIGARKELMSFYYSKSKKHCEQAVNQFIWNYGWKIKENTTT